MINDRALWITADINNFKYNYTSPSHQTDAKCRMTPRLQAPQGYVTLSCLEKYRAYGPSELIVEKDFSPHNGDLGKPKEMYWVRQRTFLFHRLEELTSRSKKI